MKNLTDKINMQDMMFSLFTKTAVDSSARCPFAIWQEPKMPECLLKREMSEDDK